MDLALFKEIFRDSGHKLTSQRKIVFKGLKDNVDKHLSPEEIHRYLVQDGQDIGIATVYRTLLLFDDLGIVQKLSFEDGVTLYELVDGLEGHNHHHLLCTICGDVTEIKGDLLIDAERKIEGNYEFKIKNHDLMFYGICKDCKE